LFYNQYNHGHVPSSGRIDLVGRRKPGLTRALTYLTGLIEDRRMVGETVLPAVRAMSARADVSVSTLMAALHLLRDRGTVTARQGSAVRVVEKSASGRPLLIDKTEGAPVVPPKWVRVAGQVGAEIASGSFARQEQLPTVKELTARYGVAYRTMKKAIAELAAKRVIMADRGRYRTSLSTFAGSSGSTVVLIAPGDTDGQIAHWTGRMQDHLRCFERECSQNSIEAVTLTWVAQTKRLHQRAKGPVSLETVVNQRPVLGIMVWVMGIWDDYIAPLVEQCAATGKPVSVLDEFGFPLRSSPRIRVFSMANSPRAGQDIARFLLSRGHRRIAYLSHVHDTGWSQTRLEGLRSVCTLSGARVLDFTRGEFHRLRGVREYTLAMSAAVDSFLSKANAAHDKEMSAAAHVISSLGSQTHALFDRDAAEAALAPLFQQAVADPKITAWVGVSDETALSAWSFLKRRSVKVPDNVALVGMDDSNEAFLKGLSSYSFNSAGTVHAMMTHLLSPGRLPAYGRRTDREEIPGYVVERLSTAVRR
jgi:DNA-binding LacI/PurR family transcriptional regulator/DNA-binding transcriptional regulator YhcF (GntR family)